MHIESKCGYPRDWLPIQLALLFLGYPFVWVAVGILADYTVEIWASILFSYMPAWLLNALARICIWTWNFSIAPGPTPY